MGLEDNVVIKHLVKLHALEVCEKVWEVLICFI